MPKDFDVLESEQSEPGTVMVIEQEGKIAAKQHTLRQESCGCYIRELGDYKPGLVLDKKQSRNIRKSVSLMGKVYCKVDAQCSPIEVGDLLTISATPGHAMKASEPIRVFGSVIGRPYVH